MGVLLNTRQPLSLPRFPFRGKELEGCVLYASLWDEKSRVSPFPSLDPNHHLLTVTGAIWTPPTGYVFDGNDYIKNSTANWRSSDQSGTFVIWSKQTVNGALFGSCDEATDSHQFFMHVATGFQVGVAIAGVASFVTGNTSLVDGLWHCCAWVSNGTVWTMFVDNIPQTLTLGAGTNDGQWLGDVANRDNFSIGARLRLSATYYTGSVGEVLYYNRALTASEILMIYEKTKWRYV